MKVEEEDINSIRLQLFIQSIGFRCIVDQLLFASWCCFLDTHLQRDRQHRKPYQWALPIISYASLVWPEMLRLIGGEWQWLKKPEAVLRCIAFKTCQVETQRNNSYSTSLCWGTALEIHLAVHWLSANLIRFRKLLQNAQILLHCCTFQLLRLYSPKSASECDRRRNSSLTKAWLISWYLSRPVMWWMSG